MYIYIDVYVYVYVYYMRNMIYFHKKKCIRIVSCMIH